MSWAIIGQGSAPAAGASPPPTVTIPTTGADLIVVGGTSFLASISGATDVVGGNNNGASSNLTEQAIILTPGAEEYRLRLMYWWHPTFTGASHAFTLASGDYADIFAIAVSGSRTTSDPFRDQSGAVSVGSATTIQPSASVGAAGDFAVTITMSEENPASLASINQSFAYTATGGVDFEVGVGGVNVPGALAYKLLTAAAQPTWTYANPSNLAVAIAAFIAASTPQRYVLIPS